MAPAYSKLREPWRQRYWPILLALSILFMAEVCEAQKRGRVLCGESLDDMLMSICKNGFNKKNLSGALQRVRSRRQADIFLSPHIFKEQFDQLDTLVPTKHKRKPSLKQMLKTEARWRRKHQITGKRLRRQSQPRVYGVADECCSHGCAYSEIARYCRNLS
ncbi:PREDICTED: probable insulin-like peptide 4 [Rhagoletis zephyria]|uniref:probable insulin-like peptide 4 n=1 Tax=Rhagoletis zephyria TaxID=28612 RepID=UPI000811872A|nr:PREDICTED: probable insulin-like peptide 4 [Rhagoletis zephyria]